MVRTDPGALSETTVARIDGRGNPPPVPAPARVSSQMRQPRDVDDRSTHTGGWADRCVGNHRITIPNGRGDSLVQGCHHEPFGVKNALCQWSRRCGPATADVSARILSTL